MKALIDVKPTPEQLALFSRIRHGVEIIRGAAGSGKTTTALLKLRAAVGSYLMRAQRQKSTAPVRVLVLTFNRTLRGYVEELARQQLPDNDKLTLDILTFSNWAKELADNPPVLSAEDGERELIRLAAQAKLDLSPNFVLDEVSYVLGRFLPEHLDDYLTARRDGRGVVPRMERPVREVLLNQVIRPYAEYKEKNGALDWNDLAVNLTFNKYAEYDVVVVDEAQDFSANEIRGLMNQLSKDHTVTFVLDSAQRIYAKNFNWSEVGILIRPENSHRLGNNYRNTKQIARFAAGIMDGIVIDDDGSMPRFESAKRDGELPRVLEGKFSAQAKYAINFIKKSVNLNEESVAFLHAKGGGWFSTLRSELEKAGLEFVSISRKADWPQGAENIALSTLHSAKGLEFDHVFLLGLNGEVLPWDDDDSDIADDDERLARFRRLVAMGVGRARKSVIIGFKPEDKPVVAAFFQGGTYEAVRV